MILGVTGDTHNNLKNIDIICDIFNENYVDLVLHSGDISLPKSLFSFNKLNCPIITVLGNNDIEERDGLEEVAKKFDCNVYDEPHSLEVQNTKITLIHHPELIDETMLSINDYIIHGHTHRYALEKRGKCTIFNPGECAGIMKGKNQVGLIDLEKQETKIVSF